MTVAAKTATLEDFMHSESASDLQQYLYHMCKEKIGILGIESKNYVHKTFMFFYVILVS